MSMAAWSTKMSKQNQPHVCVEVCMYVWCYMLLRARVHARAWWYTEDICMSAWQGMPMSTHHYHHAHAGAKEVMLRHKRQKVRACAKRKQVCPGNAIKRKKENAKPSPVRHNETSVHACEMREIENATMSRPAHHHCHAHNVTRKKVRWRGRRREKSQHMSLGSVCSMPCM